jgi:hypothetical protein
VHQQVAQALEQRQREGSGQRPQRQQDAEDEVLRGNEQCDGAHHESTVQERPHRVEGEPAALALLFAAVGIAHAEQAAFHQMREVLVGTHAQVGDLHQVGQDVVPVVAQQRVGVEHHRGDAGDDHDVIEHRARQAGLHVDPRKHGERGDKHFDDHPGGAHHQTPVGLTECRGGRGIDIGNRHQHEQHDAHLVHFSAPCLYRAGMAELVEQLHQREDQQEQQQVLRREHLRGDIVGKVAPVRTRLHRAGGHHDTPRQHPDPAEPGPVPGQPALQRAIGIDQRDADGKRREQVLQPGLPATLARAARELREIRHRFALQHLGRVQLPEQADDLVLRGRVIAEALGGAVPDLLHRALAVEQPDHVVRDRIEAVHLVGDAVLQHVPQLAAVVVAVDARVGAQPRPQLRHPVPR